jgi:hypothetical protein
MLSVRAAADSWKLVAGSWNSAAGSWKLVAGSSVLAVLALTACSDLRVKEGIYANLDEAKVAGAIQAGWVPAGLPPGVADLREGHLPGGRHWGVFTFGPRDADALRSLVGPEITMAAPACDPPGRLEWWPQILHTPIDLDGVRSTGFRLYSDRVGEIAFAINWGQGRAYYWRG